MEVGLKMPDVLVLQMASPGLRFEARPLPSHLLPQLADSYLSFASVPRTTSSGYPLPESRGDAVLAALRRLQRRFQDLQAERDAAHESYAKLQRESQVYQARLLHVHHEAETAERVVLGELQGSLTSAELRSRALERELLAMRSEIQSLQDRLHASHLPSGGATESRATAASATAAAIAEPAFPRPERLLSPPEAQRVQESFASSSVWRLDPGPAMQAYQTRLQQQGLTSDGGQHAFPPAFAELDLEEDGYRRPPSVDAPAAPAAANLFRFSDNNLTAAAATASSAVSPRAGSQTTASSAEHQVGVSAGRTAPNDDGLQPQAAALRSSPVHREAQTSPTGDTHNLTAAAAGTQLQRDSESMRARSSPALKADGGMAASGAHPGTAAKATVGVQAAGSRLRATPPEALANHEALSAGASGREGGPEPTTRLRQQPLEQDSLEDFQQDPRLRQAGARFETEIRSLLRKTAPHRRHGRRPWRRPDPGEASSADTTREEAPDWDAEEADVKVPDLEHRRTSSPHRKPVFASPVDSDLATVMARLKALEEEAMRMGQRQNVTETEVQALHRAILEVQQQYHLLEHRRKEQRRQGQHSQEPRRQEQLRPRDQHRPQADSNLPATTAGGRHPPRVITSTAARGDLGAGRHQGYMRPTVAWRSHVESRRQEAQSIARASVIAGSGLPFNAVPFVAGTSTEPSQSLAGNLQQILALLKQQGRPLHPSSEADHLPTTVPGVRRHVAADCDEKRHLLQQAREAQTQLRLADLQWLPASSA